MERPALDDWMKRSGELLAEIEAEKPKDPVEKLGELVVKTEAEDVPR